MEDLSLINSTAIIVGAGRVGQTFGAMLSSAGVRVLAATSRSQDLAERAAAHIGAQEAFSFDTASVESSKRFLDWLAAQVSQLRMKESTREEFPVLNLFLCTHDDALSQAAAMLVKASEDWSGTAAILCAGGLEIDELSCFSSLGAQVGRIHPCYSVFAPQKALPREKRVCYAVSAEGSLWDFLTTLVKRWDGSVVSAQGIQPLLYHAGVVMAAGHLVAQLSSAAELLRAAGLPEEDAKRVVYSLSLGVLENVKLQSSFAEALTGPFSRGDSELIAKQRFAIEQAAPELLEAYDILGEISKRLKETV